MYSPKAQNPEVFKKNTIKNQVTFSRKVVALGSTIEFESKHEETVSDDNKKEVKGNPLDRFFDFMKDQFYNRMKVFFEFEDKYREKSGVYGFIEKP